jgi:hypothetical protein
MHYGPALSRRHFGRPKGRQRLPRPSTAVETIIRYAAIAVVSGLGVALAANTWESAQERQAILDALPAGYSYSNCAEVRVAGVAPIYSQENGFSERLDGDGDSIGCEPYRGQ